MYFAKNQMENEPDAIHLQVTFSSLLMPFILSFFINKLILYNFYFFSVYNLKSFLNISYSKNKEKIITFFNFFVTNCFT